MFLVPTEVDFIFIRRSDEYPCSKDLVSVQLLFRRLLLGSTVLQELFQKHAAITVYVTNLPANH